MITSDLKPVSEKLDSLIERIGSVALPEILREVLRRGAVELSIERVGYWSLDEDGKGIQRELQFVRSEGVFDETLLHLDDVDFPEYFKALRHGSSLMVSDDTMADPRLVEFRDNYFNPLGIASMLDAPVHRNGKLFGVMCHEHVGDRRQWTAAEIDFARYAAQWIALAVEIDSRQKAESALRESEATCRMLIEHTPAATVIIDVETGRFVDANVSACQLFGKGKSSLLLGGPADFSPEFQPDGRLSGQAAVEKITLALAGKESRFEWTHLGTGGREIPCLVHLARMPGGRTHRVIATVTDRTEQIRNEETIRRALDNERENNEQRARFTSVVSHEFRTPLGVIMSAVELLGNYFDRLAPENRDELLEDIRHSTQRMAGMMEQVLVLGRADEGKLPFSPAPVDLAQFALKLTEEASSATAQRCPVSLMLGEGLDHIMADEFLLRHIFTNVLSNAAKYSPVGSQIHFRIHRDGSDVAFVIADHGIGIPLSDQPRIFGAFQRADNVGEVPGTGLGLLIVKRCVELHGGEIDFNSTPGEGTTFTVKLPLVT